MVVVLLISTYDGSTTATVSVQNDGTTLTVGGGGVKVSDAGITATQLASSVAGDGLAGGAGTALSVQVDDSSIEITGDSLNVKELGVTNAMLAGSIGNNKLANASIGVGSTSIQLGGSDNNNCRINITYSNRIKCNKYCKYWCSSRY